MKNKDKTAPAAKPESEASKKARAARDKARREAAKASKAAAPKQAPAKPAKPVKASKLAEIANPGGINNPKGKIPAKKAAPVKKPAVAPGKPDGKAKPAPKSAAKVPAKKAAKSFATSVTVAKTPKSAKVKEPLKVVTGHKAGTLPGDVTQNGILQPREGTQARKLWAVCDSLKKTLGRPPARFEFRKAIQDFKGTDGVTTVNADSASYQYFAWRKFHGVKGRSIGVYPKRNTFEANTPEPVKPAAKKSAKK